MPRLLLPFLFATMAHAMLLLPDPEWMRPSVPPRAATRTIRMHLLSRSPQPTSPASTKARTPKKPPTPLTSKKPENVKPKIAKPPKPKATPIEKPKKKKVPDQTRIATIKTTHSPPATPPSPDPVQPADIPPETLVDAMEAIEPLPQAPLQELAFQKPATDRAVEPHESESMANDRSLANTDADRPPPPAGIDHEAVPLYRTNPSPPYPRLARKRGFQGEVQLEVLVGIGGEVQELKIHRSSGHPVLDRQAVKTVSKWRFEPAKRGTTPVAMWVRVPVNFVLTSP